jgi:hypothetical protein
MNQPTNRRNLPPPLGAIRRPSHRGADPIGDVRVVWGCKSDHHRVSGVVLCCPIAWPVCGVCGWVAHVRVSLAAPCPALPCPAWTATVTATLTTGHLPSATPTCYVAHREKAILGITVVDESGRVVGHASFSDAPTIPGVHPSEWLDYVKMVRPGRTTDTSAHCVHIACALSLVLSFSCDLRACVCLCACVCVCGCGSVQLCVPRGWGSTWPWVFVVVVVVVIVRA